MAQQTHHIGDANKMMTAVEWLSDNLIGNPYCESDFAHNVRVFKQAKDMEKEQIETAFKDGVYEGVLTDINYLHCDEDAEFYYNSRYK